MSFFPNILSAAIKVTCTPIAIIKDIGCVAIGIEADSTKELLKSAGDDATQAMNDIT